MMPPRARRESTLIAATPRRTRSVIASVLVGGVFVMQSGDVHCTEQRGLYDPRFEHDACGIGFVARLTGEPGHDILAQARTAVANMAHRGGIHADGKSGDGAGLLTQIPRAFFARELTARGIPYPVADLAVGMVFLPQEAPARLLARRLVSEGLAHHGLTLLGWRPVPVDPAA